MWIIANGKNNRLQAISVQHDNDFLLGIDRYYTAGTFIEYRKQLAGDFIFKRTPDSPLQLDLTLGQDTYTPRELFETDFNRLERPYAGYLFCLLYTSPSPRDATLSRMPSSA